MKTYFIHSLFLFFFSVLCAAEPAAYDAVERLRKTPELHSFRADDGTHLAYSIIGKGDENSRPLIFAPGKGETVYRYLELAESMQEKGYGPIYILDHRSQGFSDRAIPQKPNVLHVDSFDTFVDDFIKFIDGPVKKDLATKNISRKPYIIAHSMGAAITNLALRKRPDITDRVAYVSPMFEIDFGKKMKVLRDVPVKILAEVLCFAGCGNLAIGRAPGAPRAKRVSSSLQRLAATDKIEHDLMIDATQASISWVRSAIEATEKVRSSPMPQTKSVIFQARHDQLVRNSALYEYACKAENCSLVELPESHAIHQGKDSNLKVFYEKVDDFFRTGSIPEPKAGCERQYKLLVP